MFVELVAELVLCRTHVPFSEAAEREHVPVSDTIGPAPLGTRKTWLLVAVRPMYWLDLVLYLSGLCHVKAKAPRQSRYRPCLYSNRNVRVAWWNLYVAVCGKLLAVK